MDYKTLTRKLYLKQHKRISKNKEAFNRIFGIYTDQNYGLGNKRSLNSYRRYLKIYKTYLRKFLINLLIFINISIIIFYLLYIIFKKLF